MAGFFSHAIEASLEGQNMENTAQDFSGQKGAKERKEGEERRNPGFLLSHPLKTTNKFGSFPSVKRDDDSLVFRVGLHLRDGVMAITKSNNKGRKISRT